jgi:Uncharacterized protein conserved in bacteria (DUF2188)
MNNNPKSLHVNPLGENWEVESDSATLGQAESKSEAIELAKELAATSEVPNVTVHTADGSVDRERFPGRER